MARQHRRRVPTAVESEMRRLHDPVQRARRAVTTAGSAVAQQYRSLRLLREMRLAILGIANVLDTMSGTIVVPFLPTLAQDVGAGPFVIGLVFTAPAVVGAVVRTPAGYLSDRLGRRSLIWSGVTASGLPVMAIAFAGSPLGLLVLRGLDGLARAFVSPATNAYLGDMYAEEERGSAFGVYHTTTMVGAAAGPMVGGVMAELGGIRWPFLVLGAGTSLGGLVLFAFLPAADGGPHDGNTPSSARPTVSREAIGAFLSASSIAWLVAAFLNEFGTNALNPIFPLLLHETVGRGPAYAGTTYSTLAIAMLVFTPIGGRFVDRLGRIRVLIASQVGWFVVMVGLAIGTSPVLPPALMFLGGVCSAFAAPAWLALRHEIAPDGREATFTGITGTASSIGAAVGPLVAGAMAGSWGVRSTAIAAGLSWVAAIPLFLFFVPEPSGVSDD